jgi:hypothetical protein
MLFSSGDTKAHRLRIRYGLRKHKRKRKIMFPYGAIELAALELALSPERLQPYMTRAGGNRHRAILLYERNTALSEALYGVTQAAEIAVRNAIHRVLSVPHGLMWFEAVGLEGPQLDKVLNAKYELDRNGRALTPGAVVAELNLGFWTSLVSTRYEKQLWVPHLHKAFPHALRTSSGKPGAAPSPISRAEIFDQLESVRNLRNRIAHHEPILKLDLPRIYSGTLEALKWVCPVTAEWTRSTNSFPRRFHETPLSYAAPKFPPASSNAKPGMPAAVPKKK